MDEVLNVNSFGLLFQDLTGGTLVPVEGPNSPLFALEVRGVAFSSHDNLDKLQFFLSF